MQDEEKKKEQTAYFGLFRNDSTRTDAAFPPTYGRAFFFVVACDCFRSSGRPLAEQIVGVSGRACVCGGGRGWGWRRCEVEWGTAAAGEMV